MSYDLAYWIGMLLLLLFGGWSSREGSPVWAKTYGNGLILFFLLVIIGLKVFGKPLHP